MNSNIFKSTDIRGVYPKDLDENSAEIIGRSIAKFLKQEYGKNLVVARDSRESSPSLLRALLKGMYQEGTNLTNLGISPSPMFYYAIWNHRFSGGVIVTASHNPPEFNGFKIMADKAKIIGKNTGLQKIKEIALDIASSEENSSVPLKNQNEIMEEKTKEIDVLEEYLKFNLEQTNLKNTGKLKVVIDTGNAVAGKWIKDLKSRVPFDIYHLFSELDPNFPNHNPNPLEEENLASLKKKVLEESADLGIAFDGDGDRIIFINEKGERIFSDFITCLLSEDILKTYPRESIVYNICSSNIIKDIVEESGGKPIVSPVGHTFIREKMREKEAIFAGEYSGHFFLRKHYFCEAPLEVLFKIVEKISKENKSISNILKKYQKYCYSGVINLIVENKKEKLKQLEEKYIGGEINHLDGVRIDFDNWWFIARPSNTENLLRIAVEAGEESKMKEKLEEIKEIISSSKSS